MFFDTQAQEEQDEFDTESSSYGYEGGDVDFIRLGVVLVVIYDGPNRLDTHYQVDRSHAIVVKELAC
jgi:hypothetical protein